MSIRAILALVLAVGISVSIPLLVGGRDVLDQFATISPSFAVLLTLMVFGKWILNAERGRVLLTAVGTILTRRTALAYTMACDFAVKSTPAGSGGPVVAVALLKRSGLGPAGALSMFVVVHLVDIALVALLAGIITILAYASWAHADLVDPLLLSLLFLTLILLSLFLVARYNRQLLLISGRILRRTAVSQRILSLVSRETVRIRHQLGKYRNLNFYDRALFIVLSATFWLIQSAFLFVSLLSLGVDIQWSAAACIQLISMGLGRLFMLPGGAGAAEASGIALLSIWTEPATAATAILLWRAVTLYLGLSLGGITLLLLTLVEPNRP